MNMIIKSISKDGNLISDRDLIDIKNKINSVASSVYGDEEGIEWHVWGESIILSEMSDYLVKNQLFSIFLTLSVILIILVIYFKSFVIGLSGLIPLSFAIAVNILLMYFMKISLNVSTILTAGIVTGIGVDDFIHTVNCIRGNSEGAESFTGFSLYRPLSLSITPVIVTSLALSGSFLLFTLSRFKPVSNFGLLVSLSILSSTFANVYIVPAFSFLYVKKGQLETD